MPVSTSLIATIVVAWFLSPIGAASVSMSPAAAQSDQSGATSADIAALQRRLTDAGCYHGATDGIASADLDAATQACPSQDPILRIETGMHDGAISELAADLKCTVGVTVSPDKTIRIWRLPDGHPLKVVRLPIGPENAGRFKAVAISPDGSTAAVGGFDADALKAGNGLYLIDLAGRLPIRRIALFQSDIFSLAYSPDGRTIGLALSPDGVRVVDATTGNELMADRAFRGPLRTATKVMFGPDGSLYAGGDDGVVRRYAPDRFQRVAVSKAVRGAVRAMAIQPGGGMIAVSHETGARIDFLDAQTLRKVGAAQTSREAAASFGSVYLGLAWLTDDTLIAGGRGSDDRSDHMSVIQTFDASGRQVGEPRPVAHNSVTAVTPCGSRALFGSADPSLGFIGANDAGSIIVRGHIADLRAKLDKRLKIAPDGSKVYFGLVQDTDPVLFDVSSSTLSTATSIPDGLVSSNITGIPLSQGPTPSSFYLGRLKLTLPGGNIVHCFAVRDDATALFMGTEFGLARISRKADLEWFERTRGPVWGVDLARGGDLVVTAQADGAVHWTRGSDGHDLLTLFVDVPTKRWVAWTPSGYYMASPGGEGLIGWHVNRGWTQEADFFPASQFRDRFNRPDIVQLILTTMDEDAAVTQANLSARRKAVTSALITQLPPVIHIVDPAGGTHVADGQVKIDYVWRSPSGQPVDRIDVLVDGRPAKELGLPVQAADASADVAGTVTVALAARDSEVGLIAWSGTMASQAANVRVTWDGAPATSLQARHLYAVVAGVSRYAEADMTLGFPAKDANDFAAALQAQRGLYYAGVETHVLTDTGVTRMSLVEALDWLASKVTTKDDVGVLFLAGHGVTDDRQTYWFLPADATEETIHVKGVSQDEIRRALQALPGKVLWFLDTCHAGTAAKRSPVDVSVLVNTVTASENGGIVAFASSTGREVSEESAELGNGAFTKALLEGIQNGKADLFGEGNITTSELDAYIERRVPLFTHGRQHPVMGRPPDEPDFTIAAVAGRH